MKLVKRGGFRKVGSSSAPILDYRANSPVIVTLRVERYRIVPGK